MQRRLFRCVPFFAYERGDPPSFLYTSGRPNRCNPRGVNCLYFSEETRTADAEYRLVWRGTPAEHQPKITFRALVSFRRVLDLENSQARRTLSLRNEDFFENWRLKPAPTRLQELGGAISRQRSIVALRYPSAAAKRLGKPGWNVAIFPSGLAVPDRLEILGDSTVPLEVLP
jgi:RES domain-containing protein